MTADFVLVVILCFHRCPELYLSNLFSCPSGIKRSLVLLMARAQSAYQSSLSSDLKPQCAGDTHSFSIFRLHSIALLHLWLRETSFSTLLPPLKEDRHWLTQGRVPLGLLSILPALKLKWALQEVSALLDLPTTIPCLSLMPMNLRWGQGIFPEADCFCCLLNMSPQMQKHFS